MYLATKGGETLEDTNKKSRSEYFQERRKKKYTFYATIDKEKGQALEKHLQENNQTKTSWLNEKIDQDTKK